MRHPGACMALAVFTGNDRMKRMKKMFLCAGLLAGILFFGCNSSTGPDLTAPPVPQNLVFTEIGNGAATLSWTALSDRSLVGYIVYWQAGTTVDSAAANSVTVTGNGATITGLDYETVYSFAVSSLDASGNESSLSAVRSGTPYNTTPPLPPDGLDVVAENIETAIITVRWSANTEPDIATYEIYRAFSSAGFTDTPLVTVAGTTTFIDTTAEVGAVYYYRMKAVDRGGEKSAASETVSDVILPRPVIIAPLNFEYVGSTPVFSWQAVDGAASYHVVVSTSSISGEVWSTDVDGAKTQVTYSGKTKLVSGTKYHWKVGAVSKEEVNSVSSGSFTVQ